MNILITSGGTTEPIDSVRSITNVSTGMLGSLIARAFVALPSIEKVYYICGKTAVRPESEKVESIPVGSVASLEEAITKVLSENDIDIIVHGMAVSDYRLKCVTSAAMLASTMVSQIEAVKHINEENGQSIVKKLLEDSAKPIAANGKIRSDMDDMMLLMERTPKIISLFQSLAPKSILVGFKLLNHVPHEELMEAAFSVLNNNHCRFVLANDLCDITNEQHIGYLVNRDKSYQCYQTKEEIANGIVTASTNEWEGNAE